MLNCELYRRRRGLTQRQVGDHARIGQPWISLLEQGRWLPTPDQIARVARVLGLAPDDLLKRVVATVDEHEHEQHADASVVTR